MRFAVVLSFLTSSARLTVSVSFRSLSCNLCSINCRFFACSPVPMNHSKTAHARSKDREHSQHQQGSIARRDAPHRSHSAPCPHFSPCSVCRAQAQTSSCPASARAARPPCRCVAASSLSLPPLLLLLSLPHFHLTRRRVRAGRARALLVQVSPALCCVAC